jgi:hypothetical protein
MPLRQTHTSIHRAVVTLGKLALAGATICAVAVGLVITGPDGHVQESKADIADVFLTPVTNTQRFATALDRLGHEPPRVYNYNGNNIYFSVRVSSKRPDELAREYQEEFVRQGVNEQVYSASKHAFSGEKVVGEDPDQIVGAEALLSGQIIPQHVSRDGFIMHGALIKGAPKTREQFAKNMLARTKEDTKDFPHTFQSFRGIEAEWEEQEKRTVVTATWGDEDFELLKTFAAKDGGITEDVATDPEIPVCPGCERLTRFAGASTDEDQIAHVFSTTTHPNTVLSFYERALGARGWTETEASSLTRKMEGIADLQGDPKHNRQFTKDGKFLTLNVSFNNEYNKTYVSLNNSN